MNPYQQAVDDELVCAHLGVTHPNDSFAQARKNLDALILWHCQLAIDPAVNGGFILVSLDLLEHIKHARKELTRSEISPLHIRQRLAQDLTNMLPISAKEPPPCEKSE